VADNCTELQPIVQRALDLALDGLPGPRIATELGVDRSTVWRWLQLPNVQELLARERTERREAIREGVDSGAREAVEFLRSVVAAPDLSIHARIRAAVVLLQRADLEDTSSEPMSIIIKDRPWAADLTPCQREALENCPDGLAGFQLEFDAPLPPPPDY